MTYFWQHMFGEVVGYSWKCPLVTNSNQFCLVNTPTIHYTQRDPLTLKYLIRLIMVWIWLTSLNTTRIASKHCFWKIQALLKLWMLVKPQHFVHALSKDGLNGWEINCLQNPNTKPPFEIRLNIFYIFLFVSVCMYKQGDSRCFLFALKGDSIKHEIENSFTSQPATSFFLLCTLMYVNVNICHTSSQKAYEFIFIG